MMGIKTKSMSHAATLLACITALLAMATGCSGSPTTGGDASPRVYGRLDYQGIDLSSHQDLVDWNMVAADKNVHFAYIKATQGATYHSPHYDYNVRHARENGILVGSYHFFSTTATVSSQVENFLQYVKPDMQDLVPMLDVERCGDLSRRQLQDSVMAMATSLQLIYGSKPIIYSTQQFYNTYLAPQFNSFPLYIARYSNIEPQLHWQGQYTLWQFSDQGVVPGIGKFVDLCRLRPGASLNDIKLPTSNRPATE